MFRKEADFEAFERVMVESHEREPLRILSYCVLSNREIPCRQVWSKSATVAMGQLVVEGARRRGDPGLVVTLAGAAAGKLDGSRHCTIDRERIKASATEPRARKTLWQRRVGQPNGKGTRPGAHHTPRGSATQDKPDSDRLDAVAKCMCPKCGASDTVNSSHSRSQGGAFVFLPRGASQFPSWGNKRAASWVPFPAAIN